ncbi:ABC transporter permease [Sphaerimonospora sp. CA-214678]|uniref:ABC transporter permease n=1 Tax=Sphaerimonospora sp. CA-214678 TaxID=3240029 RepID=UPI003D8D14F6
MSQNQVDAIDDTDSPVPAPAAGRGWRQALDRWMVWWTTPLVLVAIYFGWKLYLAITDLSPFVMPTPEAVLAALKEQVTDPYIWQVHVWATFTETLSGLAIAIAVGVTLGFLIGKSRILARILKPFVVATQVTPKVALAPLFVLWFGFGPGSKIALAAIVAFFPIMTNTAFGVQSLPRSTKEMCTSVGASDWYRFRKVDLPHTLAYILAGMEVAIVLATIGAIVGEYLGGDKGLGRYALNLQNNLQIDMLFGSIVLMAVFGLVLYGSVVALKRLLIPWHESVRALREEGV